MYKVILLIVILFLSIGCETPFEPPEYSIDVYSELPMDQNGYYHFDYPDGNAHTYSYVKYTINPASIIRVWWDSPDSFYTEHQGMKFGTPIINYSTYSNEDGSGKQLFYIYEDFIGDTLEIYGFAADQHIGLYDYNGIKVIIDN